MNSGFALKSAWILHSNGVKRRRQPMGWLLKAAFIVFALFVSISAAYVAFRLIRAAGLSSGWAIPVAGVVFVLSVIAVERNVS